MPDHGPPLAALLIVLGLAFAAVVALAVHLVVPRYGIANAVCTALVLGGCVLFHHGEGRLIPSDIVMLYGIGLPAGLAFSAAVGLPVVLTRRALARDEARRLADRWDARERRSP